jgi:hypothetical protein
MNGLSATIPALQNCEARFLPAVLMKIGGGICSSTGQSRLKHDSSG